MSGETNIPKRSPYPRMFQHGQRTLDQSAKNPNDYVTLSIKISLPQLTRLRLPVYIRKHPYTALAAMCLIALLAIGGYRLERHLTHADQPILTWISKEFTQVG